MLPNPRKTPKPASARQVPHTVSGKCSGPPPLTTLRGSDPPTAATAAIKFPTGVLLHYIERPQTSRNRYSNQNLPKKLTSSQHMDFARGTASISYPPSLWAPCIEQYLNRYILQTIQGKLDCPNPGQVDSINKQKIETANAYCFLGARGGVARLRHGSHEGPQTLSSNFQPGGFKFGVQIYPQGGSNLLFKFP